jgi:anti-anti-sigma factor
MLQPHEPSRRPADDLVVQTEYGDSLAIVHPNGVIDPHNREVLRESLAVLDRDVVVDLTGVSVLDSSAITVLVAQRARLEADGWTLRMVNPSRQVRNVLTIAGLDAWLEY